MTYENIIKVATGQVDDYITGCLLDYPHLKDSYEMIAVNLNKQQEFDVNPRANQKINFTTNLNRENHIGIYLIFEEAKETKLDFSQGTVKVL